MKKPLTDGELLRRLKEIEVERKRQGLPELYSAQAISHVDGCSACERSEFLAKEVVEHELFLRRSRAPGEERQKIATMLLERMEPGRRRLSLAKGEVEPLVTYEYDRTHKKHIYRNRHGAVITETNTGGSPLGAEALRKLHEHEEHVKSMIAGTPLEKEAKDRAEAAQERKTRHDKAITKILEQSGAN